MISYKSSGVNIDLADMLIGRLKVKLPVIGFFSGLFPLKLKGYREPLLVASTDGVGTKLLVAHAMNRHKTIGIDLVAMVVNDLCVCGAKSLFFLDYFATGKLRLGQAEDILEGIMAGCRQADCPLIGGETAELPGLYQKGHYDLAGFGVGIVDKRKIIDGKTVRKGDVFIGVSSNGLHSNGYSLARKVLLEKAKIPLKRKHPLLGESLGEALLRPTLIYSPLALALIDKVPVKGMAHITGGGIPGNLNRILPPGIDADIDAGAIMDSAPPVFHLIRKCGPVSTEEMFRTFNMGVGYVVAVEKSHVKKVHILCRKMGFVSREIGHAVKGGAKVRLNFRNEGE
ncbi:phosphoribosylformylglycinamidine cyclo-ligase [Candidatus Sumerlaeota bacterium]|nr:phosphoribosylformylglycinamidine cyclo-ligase [Candidatus Sumerlaeota bacterium]